MKEEVNKHILDKKRVSSLLQLIDDPDMEIFESVSEEIVKIGKPMMEPLEHLWETTLDTQMQQRIESLMHALQLNDIKYEWQEWREKKGTLLEGLILVAKYKYPNLPVDDISHQYEKIRRNIWLELNQYLNGIEQLNIIVGILYSYYKLQGVAMESTQPEHFFINDVLEDKVGNSYSLGVLIASLMDVLDVPLKCLELPYQFVLAYFEKMESFFTKDDDITRIGFYMDPNNGYIFNQRDIDAYFKKIDIEPVQRFFLPLSNEKTMYSYLCQLSVTYEIEGDFDSSSEIESIIQFAFADLSEEEKASDEDASR